jgi:cytochrome P450
MDFCGADRNGDQPRRGVVGSRAHGSGGACLARDAPVSLIGLKRDLEIENEPPALEDLQLPEVDFFGPGYLADPLAVCAAAREEAWAAKTGHGPLILTYSDVNELLRYPEEHMYEMDIATMLRPETEEDFASAPIQDWIEALRLFMGPDSQHVRLRRLCNSLFTPSVVDRWRPAMRETAQRLAAEFRTDGECEFVGDFANLYPAHVFARIIGLPEQEVPAFARWSGDIGLTFIRPLAPVRERAEAAIMGLFGYVEDLIERRRNDPSDDLISGFLELERAGELSSREIRALGLALIQAGHETTKSQLSFCLWELTKHPEVWKRLRVEPSIALSVVNEAMRLHPIIPEPGRQPATDIVHHGVRIRAGTPLFLSAASANRDPALFDDPDAFDPDRSNAGKQLGFGAGPHYCLGANLARAEMAEALPVLAEAMPGIRLVEFKEVEGQNTIRRAESLRLVFDVPA